MVKNPFQALVDFIGGGSQAELTRRVSAALSPKDSVTPQAVSKWSKQIPPERVLLLEELSDGRVTRYDMRPDIFGPAPKRTDKVAA